MVSPFALHQHQLAYVSQQQALLLAVAQSEKAPSFLPARGIHQRSVSDSNTMQENIAAQSWANHGYQVPGNVPPAGQLYANHSSQVMKIH